MWPPQAALVRLLEAPPAQLEPVLGPLAGGVQGCVGRYHPAAAAPLVLAVVEAMAAHEV